LLAVAATSTLLLAFSANCPCDNARPSSFPYGRPA
jgi:hypothetical protein